MFFSKVKLFDEGCVKCIGWIYLDQANSVFFTEAVFGPVPLQLLDIGNLGRAMEELVVTEVLSALDLYRDFLSIVVEVEGHFGPRNRELLEDNVGEPDRLEELLYSKLEVAE